VKGLLKTRERQDDGDSATNSATAVNLASVNPVYVDNSVAIFSKDIDKAQIEKRHLQRHIERLQQWQSTIHANNPEPKPSIFRRVRGIVIRVFLVAMLVDLIRTIYANKNQISRPPGSFLSSVAEFVFSKKTVELVVTPIISDMQVEYFEAFARHRKIKAAWIRLRGYWSLFKALGLYSILKMFVDAWRKISSV
jgi:hypothetical protein